MDVSAVDAYGKGVARFGAESPTSLRQADNRSQRNKSRLEGQIDEIYNKVMSDNLPSLDQKVPDPIKKRFEQTLQVATLILKNMPNN